MRQEFRDSLYYKNPGAHTVRYSRGCRIIYGSSSPETADI